jgi:hypothetical protein
MDDLDGFVRRKVRKEQVKLRKARFGDAKETGCALCGRTLPTSIVRLAHIKRRSHAVKGELLNLDNTMPASQTMGNCLSTRQVWQGSVVTQAYAFLGWASPIGR